MLIHLDRFHLPLWIRYTIASKLFCTPQISLDLSLILFFLRVCPNKYRQMLKISLSLQGFAKQWKILRGAICIACNLSRLLIRGILVTGKYREWTSNIYKKPTRPLAQEIPLHVWTNYSVSPAFQCVSKSLTSFQIFYIHNQVQNNEKTRQWQDRFNSKVLLAEESSYISSRTYRNFKRVLGTPRIRASSTSI